MGTWLSGTNGNGRPQGMLKVTERRVEGPYDHDMQIERFALIWIALDESADC